MVLLIIMRCQSWFSAFLKWHQAQLHDREKDCHQDQCHLAIVSFHPIVVNSEANLIFIRKTLGRPQWQDLDGEQSCCWVSILICICIWQWNEFHHPGPPFAVPTLFAIVRKTSFNIEFKQPEYLSLSLFLQQHCPTQRALELLSTFVIFRENQVFFCQLVDLFAGEVRFYKHVIPVLELLRAGKYFVIWSGQTRSRLTELIYY